MKRLVTLLLAIVGLAALVGGCGGGEEEGVILAVAFRLDAGSPVLSAYTGHPTQDPFQLPAGRYYVEALDQDGAVISLGAVDIEEGGVVGLPSSFDAAGGVADPEQAQALITVASFVVDVKLAELTFLEIFTGGFTELPFDPAVEVSVADVGRLLDMYGDIGEQGEAVLEAVSKIEGQAEVSLGRLWVRSSWAPAGGEFDDLRQLAGDFTNLALGLGSRHRRLTLEFAGSIKSLDQGGEGGSATFFGQIPSSLTAVGDHKASNLDEWLGLIEQGRLDDRLTDIDTYLYGAAQELAYRATWGWDSDGMLARVTESSGAFLLTSNDYWQELGDPDEMDDYHELRNAWERHARALLDRLGDPAQARVKLEESIGRYFDTRGIASPDARRRLTQYFAARVVRGIQGWPTSTPAPQAAAAPTPLPTVPPPTSTPSVKATSTPDASWIDGFVQRVRDRMTREGYPEEITNAAMEELSDCLHQAVLAGKSMDEAVTDCAQTFTEPTPTPKPTPEPTAAPPPPQAAEVSAVGEFVLNLGAECVIKENTMTFTYNSGGGPGSVTGEGRARNSCSTDPSCPQRSESVNLHFTGEYDPDSGAFSGTADMEIYITEYGAGCEEITVANGGGRKTFRGERPCSRGGSWPATSFFHPLEPLGTSTSTWLCLRSESQRRSSASWLPRCSLGGSCARPRGGGGSSREPCR